MEKLRCLACAITLACPLAALSGCGDSATAGAADLAMAGGPKDMFTAAFDASMPPDLLAPADLTMPPMYCCGMMGDPGNSLGVGKYCKTTADCAGNGQATICATISGDASRTYCVIVLCTPGDAGDATCGENASCACSGMGCACVPLKCTGGPKPDGCM